MDRLWPVYSIWLGFLVYYRVLVRFINRALERNPSNGLKASRILGVKPQALGLLPDAAKQQMIAPA